MNTMTIPAVGGRGAVVGTGLWLFIGVATALFSLFLFTYAMRMDADDWSRIAMPWQLWLSTALLLAGSVAMRRASHTPQILVARQLLLAGGVCAWLFLMVQLWGWQALLAAQVRPAGNPAGSFFYLLTAIHALHVVGGLVAWGITMRRLRHPGGDEPRMRWSIALCARYWHFLLLVWVVLFAALGWLTPEVVRFICGTS